MPHKRRHTHHALDKNEAYPLCRVAVISPMIVILIVFLSLVLWPIERVAVFLLIAPLAAIGFFLGLKAKRRIHRRHGALRGEEAATIGLYGNGILLGVGIPLFLYGLFSMFLVGF